MDENHHFMEPPPPDTLTSCTNELTRWNSDASSLSVEDSKDIFQLSANAGPCKCAAWTYEKHNQYLNRLEASFVEQLHQSTNFFASCSEQTKNARNMPMEQTTNFVKRTAVGSGDVLRSPCVEHFKHAGRAYSTGSVDLPECFSIQEGEDLLREQRISSHRLARHSERLPVNYIYYSGSVESIAEGSGQNFVDQDCEDYSTSQTKKLKTAVVDDSSDDDQIVPCGKLHA